VVQELKLDCGNKRVLEEENNCEGREGDANCGGNGNEERRALKACDPSQKDSNCGTDGFSCEGREGDANCGGNGN